MCSHVHRMLCGLRCRRRCQSSISHPAADGGALPRPCSQSHSEKFSFCASVFFSGDIRLGFLLLQLLVFVFVCFFSSSCACSSSTFIREKQFASKLPVRRLPHLTHISPISLSVFLVSFPVVVLVLMNHSSGCLVLRLLPSHAEISSMYLSAKYKG